MAVSHQQPKMMGRRRHADDEADERPEAGDDSVTDEGSVASDDHESDVGASDTSNVDEAVSPAITAERLDNGTSAVKPPVVVSSDMRLPPETPSDKRRRETEEYKKKREEDPSLVPTRGLFFMHDQRQSGHIGGFGRGRGGGRGGARGGTRGGGRGGGLVGGSFAPVPNRMPNDPTTSATWAHDLHDSVAEPSKRYHQQHVLPPRLWSSRPHATLPSTNRGIPTCAKSETPIQRDGKETEKQLGKVPVRVWLPAAGMEKPVIVPSVVVTQYTKLPDHRPPLRSDRAVRIRLPLSPPRLIFPAEDRSFTFIPRAERPNRRQQRRRGRSSRPPSRLGSAGGAWSRRTSIFDGSYLDSVCTPNVAMTPTLPTSRRSSLDPRDIFSPGGNPIPPRLPPGAGVGVDPKPVPVVRLPSAQYSAPTGAAYGAAAMVDTGSGPAVQSSINHLPPPPPQYSLPSKPSAQENGTLVPPPIHQPLPYKALATSDIDPSLAAPQNGTGHAASDTLLDAFHQQVPVSMTSIVNGYPPDNNNMHSRRSSYAASARRLSVSGAPLVQIPERAIHAAPFEPAGISISSYGGPPHEYRPPYGPMQHPHTQPQGNYYPPPPPYGAPQMAPIFLPSHHHHHQPQDTQPPMQQPYGAASAPPPHQPEMQAPALMQPAGANHVQQEYNGMVYYFDTAELPTMQHPPMNGYPPPQPYGSPPQGYGPMPPDGYYYPQHGPPPVMVFYPQQ